MEHRCRHTVYRQHALHSAKASGLMSEITGLFAVQQPTQRRFHWGDVIVLLGISVCLSIGIALAVHTPPALRGPEISLDPSILPYYAGLSIVRMAAAYLLSLLFALWYGRAAAHNQRVERVLMPLLDVLQSVPILSFLPVVLLSLSAVLPQTVATELAAIVLIFTSQAWNLVFAWYQGLKTIPHELSEASSIFRFNGWLRFKTLELPFAAISLIWNSMMSWAGGWFFLMAAEMFTVGQRDFRLPGLGAYLRAAADHGDLHAIIWGVGALMGVIVALDQLLWRPLLAWSVRFKLEMVTSEAPPSSWCYDVLRSSRVMSWLGGGVGLLAARLDRLCMAWSPIPGMSGPRRHRPWGTYLGRVLGGGLLLYGLSRASGMLLLVPATQWIVIVWSVGATLLRVVVALLLTMAWTIP